MFHNFVHAQSHVLYCNSNSFVCFLLLRTNIKIIDFCTHFSIILKAFWHQCSILFLSRFFDDFLDDMFSTFSRKWPPKRLRVWTILGQNRVRERRGTFSRTTLATDLCYRGSPRCHGHAPGTVLDDFRVSPRSFWLDFGILLGSILANIIIYPP